MILLVCYLCFFFFQAEDGIRDLTVTGVQTCALPICAQGVGGRVVAHVIVAVREAESPLRRGRDDDRAVLEVGCAAEVEQRVPAVVVAAGQGARQVFARRDRIETGQLVFQGIGAGVLDGSRIHAGPVERAQLLVGRFRGRGGSGGEAVDDADPKSTRLYSSPRLI